MPLESLQRVSARVVAGAAIGLMFAGAIAVPAAAEDPDSVESLAQSRRFDYNGDGFNDLVYIHNNGGKLYLRAGDGSGNLGAPRYLLSGFAKMDVVMAGDVTGDGFADLVARDNRNGSMYTYPGNGAGGFGTRSSVGLDFGGKSVFAVLDYDGDGNPDLLAVGQRSGILSHYPGNGDGTFGAGVQVAEGFGHTDMLVSPGDVNGDGLGDFLVRRVSDMYVLHLSGGREIEYRHWLGDPSMTHSHMQVVSVGDLDGNGTYDLLTTDSLTGALYRQSIDSTGELGGFTTLKASGWNAYRLPAVVVDRTYDYDLDSFSDAITVHRSNDTSFDYNGNGRGGFGRTSYGGDFDDLNLIENGGDFTGGDAIPDVIGRAPATGWLYVYPNNGINHLTRERIGTGWNVMDTILGGYDYNYDGKPDILARETDGSTLWLYPGLGNGRLGARTALDAVAIAELGRITSAGDLNHDGYPDLLAVHDNGCLQLVLGQGGADYFKNGTELSCDWFGMGSADAMDLMFDMGDADSDGHNDFMARRESDGNVFFYKGDGKGGFAAPVQVSTGWQGFLVA
ncbi:FG-GAP repeat domain-containing protein [Glycomyces rhizosphaerae]|uniref:FG-GAP repeat domain-containing protein n=1 Tax=Glycomyces rhizosphaerae TaxID=2054422 RepID=A0ABV7PY31_9ACTN